MNYNCRHVSQKLKIKTLSLLIRISVCRPFTIPSAPSSDHNISSLSFLTACLSFHLLLMAQRFLRFFFVAKSTFYSASQAVIYYPFIAIALKKMSIALFHKFHRINICFYISQSSMSQERSSRSKPK